MRAGRPVAAVLVSAVVLASCAPGAETPSESAAPEVAAATPSPAPVSPAPTQPPLDRDPVVHGLDLAGVEIVEGWSPYPVFADGFDPWSDGAAMPVADWAERLLPARPSPEGSVALSVEVTLEQRPAPCFAFRRSVTAVQVDVPGLAGRAIESRLLAAALVRATEVDRFAGDEEDVAWCEERFGGEEVGFHIVEVHGEPCEHPDLPALLCATVGRLAYHLGTREFWSAETFVFDASTGERLTGDDLLEPYDDVLLRDLLERISAEVDVPHLTWVDEVLELEHGASGVSVVPTVDGLVWRWSPYAHLVGGIDLVVPWAVLAPLAVDGGGR